MNMIAQRPQRTAAESALIDAYDRRLSSLPGNAAVMMKRDDALERLKAGLPTRKVEAWHYTDLRRLLAALPTAEAAPAKVVKPLLAESAVVAVVNGAAEGAFPSLEGVAFQRLEEKLRDGSFAPALTLNGDDDAIGALNAAFVADGAFVDIAADAAPALPIELQNVQKGGSRMSGSRCGSEIAPR